MEEEKTRKRDSLQKVMIRRWKVENQEQSCEEHQKKKYAIKQSRDSQEIMKSWLCGEDFRSSRTYSQSTETEKRVKCWAKKSLLDWKYIDSENGESFLFRENGKHVMDW